MVELVEMNGVPFMRTKSFTTSKSNVECRMECADVWK